MFVNGMNTEISTCTYAFVPLFFFFNLFNTEKERIFFIVEIIRMDLPGVLPQRQDLPEQAQHSLLPPGRQDSLTCC